MVGTPYSCVSFLPSSLLHRPSLSMCILCTSLPPSTFCHYPPRSWHPVPRHTKSVGHATKDDREPEGIIRENSDCKKKSEREGYKRLKRKKKIIFYKTAIVLHHSFG
ncbi:hypothetical protein XENOCAPTIV_015667 [Xenoophorus captivus]|uniref:Uncharacterized protein n=1 Tax=Xenoophorus captivus TaxID=1517983 RepID=A0ABV0QVP8_9TELE